MRLIKIICFLLCSSFIFSTANAHDTKQMKDELSILFKGNPACVKAVNEEMSDEKLKYIHFIFNFGRFSDDEETFDEYVICLQ
jgi:hypothetical protein